MRHIIPISGKDSLCTALVQQAREPDLPYEYIFCDVRMELPETYSWLKKVESHLGVKVVRVGKSLEDVIAEEGILPSHQTRYCTRLAKIHPLRDYLCGEPAIQYLGIRADEGARAGAGFQETPTLKARYPLVECGIDLPAVYSILGSQDLLPPNFFWQRLYDEVYDRCGDGLRRYLEEELPRAPWRRASLFSWRSRSNCFMCFYQRLYEWVGLLEHHVDLFTRAEALEEEYGSVDGTNGRIRDAPFYFSQDTPLRSIRVRAEDIFNRRVRQVYNLLIDTKRASVDKSLDLLSLTSCGAYCGK